MRTKAEIEQLAKSLKPTVEAAIEKNSDEILSVRGAAKLLGISAWAIYKRCQYKQIPYTRKHGRLYFSKNAITHYYLNN